LVLEGMKAGAAGAVSGLSTAFPETVASLVHDRNDAAHDRVVSLRDSLQGIPFISSIKHLLARRGIIADPSVRAPLRGLTDAERATVGTLL
jgi:dihydrodipicolinate synthase/N-acetylneuraminate lyase